MRRERGRKMQPPLIDAAEHAARYLASVVLASGAYEPELNTALLDAMRASAAAPKLVAPRVLPGPANRAYFLDRFFTDLESLAYAVKRVTPDAEFEQQMQGYEYGSPDPVEPDARWRAMSLALSLELGASREASLYIRELPGEELVLITFAFDASATRGHAVAGAGADALPRFREFLLALSRVSPVLFATLGFDVDALTGWFPGDDFRLALPLSLDQLCGVYQRVGHGAGYDFVLLSPAVSGASKPLVYDSIRAGEIPRLGAEAGDVHELRLVEELRTHAVRAEQAYRSMYASNHPKDDRDDALGLLSRAIGLAGALGLAGIQASLSGRYEHVDAVFNSQFRR
jgi:hypothetical protein